MSLGQQGAVIETLRAIYLDTACLLGTEEVPTKVYRFLREFMSHS
jgi:hypothetical protein